MKYLTLKTQRDIFSSDSKTSFTSSDNEEETSSIGTKARLSYFSGFSHQPSKGRSTARHIVPSNSSQASTSRGEPLSLSLQSFYHSESSTSKGRGRAPPFRASSQLFPGFPATTSTPRERGAFLYFKPSVTLPMRRTTPESTYQASNPPIQVIGIENAEGEIKGKNCHVWHTKVDHALPRAGRTPAINIL